MKIVEPSFKVLVFILKGGIDMREHNGFGITVNEYGNTKIMKYAVSFLRYMRYEDGGSGCEVFEATSDKEALIVAEDECGYGKFLGEIEEEERTLESTTIQEIKEYLESNNGDGSDYIVSVINLSTGEIIFS